MLELKDFTAYEILFNLSLNFPKLVDEQFNIEGDIIKNCIYIDIKNIPNFIIYYLSLMIKKHNSLKSFLDIKNVFKDYKVEEYLDVVDTINTEEFDYLIYYVNGITIKLNVNPNYCACCVHKNYNFNINMIKNIINELIYDECKSLGLWNPINHSLYPKVFRENIVIFILSCNRYKKLSKSAINDDIILHIIRMNLCCIDFL